MKYTRETLIKRLGKYVGILPSELHDIACEAVELLERFKCSKGNCGDLNSEWISCSERLPDIDTPVIICTASGGITDGYRWNEKDWFLAWSEYNGWHDGNDGGRITAWMPLPTPYKGGDTE